MDSSNRLKTKIFDVSGYLIPLLQSAPNLGIWTGFMTMPLFWYLLMTILSIPTGFPAALFHLFFQNTIIDFALSSIGIALLLYAVVYLRIHKVEGLVTNGPFGWVRHPQYLGILLFTLGLTYRSYWILTNTFGIGFVSTQTTLLIWYVELAMYLILANIEESHLSKVYAYKFSEYQTRVPFMIPFLNVKNNSLATCVSAFLLFGILTLLIMVFP